MSSQGPAIELRHLGELLEPTAGMWLVYHVLPMRGIGVLYGEPKSGKTFWILDVAFHIATGKQWRGLATKQGPVVYAAFEGQSGIYYRVHAIRKKLNQGELFPLWICLDNLTFNRAGRP